MKAQKKPPAWPRDIYAVFKEVGIRQVAYVPDAGHTQLIKICHADKSMEVVSLTTEEEGVAMLAGAWLGGDCGALLLQSSGVGNCINLLSIMQECRVPLLMIVTMRGEWGEYNPWQIAMGQGTPPVLQHAGVIVQRADHAHEIREHVFAAEQLTFNTCRPVALLISQRVIGFKDWSK